MISKLSRTVLTVATLMATAWAHASPTVYFGENQSPSQTVSGDPLTARNAFTAALSSSASEGFESKTVGAVAPLDLNFALAGQSVGATLSGQGVVFTTPSTAGRFNTTGAETSAKAGNWWNVSGTFDLTFSTAISAFGFYGTDIGDFDGQVTITLTDVSGQRTNLTVNNTKLGNDSSLLFWGFADATNSYTKISFGNTGAGTDTFGFDDMIVGQYAATNVPEPTTLALVGLSLAGLAAARRRKAAGKA